MQKQPYLNVETVSVFKGKMTPWTRKEFAYRKHQFFALVADLRPSIHIYIYIYVGHKTVIYNVASPLE